MTSVNPPTYYFNGIQYNSEFFKSSSDCITLSEANANYLGRQGNPTSIATSTTFTGSILASGTVRANTSFINSDGTTQTSAYTGAAPLAGSYTNSNLTINNQGKITAISNGSVSSTPTLSNVLLAGNSAGSTSINMNSQNITNTNDIDFTKNSNTMKIGIGGAVNSLATNVNIGLSNIPITANSLTGGSVAIGDGALGSLTSGDTNVAIGWNSMTLTTSGISNTAVGSTTLFNNTSGQYNTAIGNRSLEALSSGNSNIGINGGTTFTTGSNNTCIGGEVNNNLTYATSIGSGAVCSTSNTIQLGRNTDIVKATTMTATTFNGDLNGSATYANSAGSTTNATNLTGGGTCNATTANIGTLNVNPNSIDPQITLSSPFGGTLSKITSSSLPLQISTTGSLKNIDFYTNGGQRATISDIAFNIYSTYFTVNGSTTINFGTNAPTMGGANISSGTIPIASVAGTAVALSGTQIITGAKTMNNASNVFYGDGSNLTGVLSTNATNVGITATNTNASPNYLTFTTATSGYSNMKIDTDGLIYYPNTNSLICIKTGVGDITTGYLTLQNPTGGEFSIDNATSSNVRMYQGATNKNINFQIYDGTIDQTTFINSLSSTTIAPNGTTALTVDATTTTVAGNLTCQNDIVLQTTQPTNNAGYLGFHIPKTPTDRTGTFANNTYYSMYGGATGFSLTPGVYIFSFNPYITSVSGTGGILSNMLTGLSTSSTAFVGGINSYVLSYTDYNTTSTLATVGNVSMTFSVPTTANYFWGFQLTFSSTVASFNGNAWFQYTRIA